MKNQYLLNFQMGYAKLTQKGCGIHLRQFARAFIFDDGTTRVVFVSADACMIAHGLKNAVSVIFSCIANLQKHFRG